MGTIATSIMITDRVSQPLRKVAQSLNTVISGFEEANKASHLNIDTSGMRQKVNELNASLDAMGDKAEESTGKIRSGVRSASDPFDGLIGKVKQLAAAYLSVEGVKKAIDISDELVSTNARLNQMNSSFQSVGKQARNAADTTSLIYQAAQDARGSFSDMASVVARFGNNARDAFSGTDEAIRFASIVQKQMTIAGASTEEAANAELQLSQALGSGVLRGDELNSIFEQAPNLIQSIADYMNKPIGQIRSMAAEGDITADIVKNAVLKSEDEVNKSFSKMPKTWAQVWTDMKNTALMAFQPVLNRINAIANSKEFDDFKNKAVNAMVTVANAALDAMEAMGRVANFVIDNWNVIGPALGIAAGAMLSYKLATSLAAGAQALLNSQLGLTVLAIGVAAAAVLGVSQIVANATGMAQTGLGNLMGSIAVLVVGIENFGIMTANVFTGVGMVLNAVLENAMTATLQTLDIIGTGVSTVAQNIYAAFYNSIANVKTCFYGLLSTAISVISQIASALSKLPFVNIDTSGLQSAASSYADKAQAAYDSRKEYKDVAGATQKAASRYSFQSIGKTWKDASSTFSYKSTQAAYDKWSKRGDGLLGKLGNRKGVSTSALTGSNVKLSDLAKGLGGNGKGAANAAKTKDNTGKTAANTGKIANKLDTTNSQLEYLRRLNEVKAINRFTTRNVKIQMNSTNNVSSDIDLEMMTDGLAKSIQSALESDMEGAIA